MPLPVNCPTCGRAFELKRDSGKVRCPHCRAETDALAFAETQAIPVKQAPAPEAGPQPAGHAPGPPGTAAVEKPPAPEAAAPPREFAGYQIVSELGRGGMGVVYKARDPKLNRTVAIKVLLAAEHASRGDVERFFREALSVAQLAHPNIVPVYELKTHGDRHYFTMDYIEGHSLDQLIKKRRPGVRRSLEIIEKVARALHHAHSRGVVHRDLKPANIIISADGEPMLTDFGLAKMAPEGGRGLLQPELTQSGLAIGTPHYMAPEQAAGRSKEADARADVYSLGCVLYELLFGEPPFRDATPMGVLRKHMEEDPSPPMSRAGRISEDVLTICLKCLEKDPARRYQSALELVEDIRSFLGGEPVVARRASMVYVLSRKIARHKKLAGVVAAAAAVLVVSTVLQVLRLHRERNRAVQELYYSNIALAQGYAREANVARVDEILRGCPPELRGWEWGRVRREAHQELTGVRLSGPAARVRFAADGSQVSAEVGGQLLTFDARTGGYQESRPLPAGPPVVGSLSADGKLLVRKGEAGVVHVLHARSGKELKSFQAHAGQVSMVACGKGGLLATTGTDKKLCIWKMATGKKFRETEAQAKMLCALSFSPDGKMMAAGDVLGLIKLWDPKTGRLIHALRGHTADITQLRYCPKGKRLASASVDRTIRVWDLGSGGELFCLRGHADSVSEVAWSPKGDRLVSCGFDPMLKIWDARQDRSHLDFPAQLGWLNSVALAPDGERLYAGGSKGIAAWDLESGEEVHRWPQEKAGSITLVLSPDGKTLASGDAEGAVRLWEAAGGELVREFEYSGEVMALAFDSSGGRLACAGAGGTIKIWNPTTGRELARPAGHAGAVRALAFSPDGRLLASGSEDRTVMVWDARTGRLVRKLVGRGGGPASCWAVAYSPDGERLASAFINRIQITDAASGRQLQVLRGHAVRVYSLAFSPDGERLASASKDGTVRLWDPRAGREFLKLEGHADWVQAVAWDRAGQRLVSAGKDGTVRIWLADNWKRPQRTRK